MKEPIGRIAHKIGRMYQAILQEDLLSLDIKRSFYPLLLIESGNGITQQELASKLQCDKVQVVRIINYLSSNGYVERKQNPADKRKYELVLTEKAKLYMPEIEKAINNSTSIALKGLTDRQINELYETISKIDSNLISHKSRNLK